MNPFPIIVIAPLQDNLQAERKKLGRSQQKRVECGSTMNKCGEAVTQVADWDDGLRVDEQEHQLNVCRGGMFRVSQIHWPIID
ncbi:LOW QUALITY PROTEIN: hypothetical protein PHMEG_00015153 [Phytophthora megakarya]|uniref:Uncharacterized protein n=1 Tax=Phytophthora megakarya TaxID=4795 RepID=A0A225W263_9STRA|nr:LOW QUALITY PROTEIN: hypothetical protein PHMEG_00015153 [Phytophthora megakarya]